jgi:hypothetical protein
MALYCYRFDQDKSTHFGPMEADGPDHLYERIATGWKWDKGSLVENAKRIWYWEIADRKDHVKMAPLDQQKPLNFTAEEPDAPSKQPESS